jgi:hypothetical protein
MIPASVLRLQIESTLSRKIPSALTPAPKMMRPVAATGIGALDDVLKGGLPIGAISEMVGPECSGRTSVALSFLAQMTQAGKVRPRCCSKPAPPESAGCCTCGCVIDVGCRIVRHGIERRSKRGLLPSAGPALPPRAEPIEKPSKVEKGGRAPVRIVAPGERVKLARL